ncbi:hypothetical protein [Methylosinus sp. PW1]|uniref:hypothetical protein n=1 Tax=Methylosinus sp. PW1 TaxID=107636 RepID=UPI00055FEB1F|nr:hypothetical protein [Methylosinus sp. PW1]
MRAPIILPILLIVTMSTPADADFAMLPSEKGEASPAPPAGDTPRPTEKRAKLRREPKPTPAPARGFGKQIPLSFAIRQIVPSTVTVRFAHEADRNALVDWRGGRAWPSVLGDAIRSLGLRAIVRERVVSITHR